MYLSDNDGQYPTIEQLDYRWALASYFKGDHPRCPLVIGKALGYEGYCFNDWLITHPGLDIKSPEMTALIWESALGRTVDNAIQPCDSILPESPDWKEMNCGGPKYHDRHNGVGNAFFLDGHVKSYPAAAFNKNDNGPKTTP
jgi:prepilin-type processing-associated H-X9-DG protein